MLSWRPRFEPNVAWRAGATPKKNAVRSVAPVVKSSTDESMWTPSARGRRASSPEGSSWTPHMATSMPRSPPHDASTRLSTANCRARRARPAPSATRIDISRCRTVVRASMRFATLAHAISRSRPTAPRRSRSELRRSPTTRSYRDTSSTRMFAFVCGKSLASRALIAVSSDCACEIVTSGFIRASMLKIRRERFFICVGVFACAPPSVVHSTYSDDGNLNQGGATPTTVYVEPVKLIVRPSTPGSPANADCHSP